MKHAAILAGVGLQALAVAQPLALQAAPVRLALELQDIPATARRDGSRFPTRGGRAGRIP